MKLGILIAALVELVSFLWWDMLPINHQSCPAYGNFMADSVLIPVSAIALCILVLLGILQYFVRQVEP